MATLNLPKGAAYLTYFSKIEGKWHFCYRQAEGHPEYDERDVHICVWDHILCTKELAHVEAHRYPYTWMSGLLLYIGNMSISDELKEAKMECNHEWVTTGDITRCEHCGTTTSTYGLLREQMKRGGMTGFTHICTACSNVFVGEMEDKICPRCLSEAEHTVQHQDGPTFTHYCQKCENTWDSSKTIDLDCPWCAVAPIATEGGEALDVQVGGSHYKDMKIQPVEFIHANNIPFIEGCCIKYLCRWRRKGGIEDLKKARHFIDLLIEMEEKS